VYALAGKASLHGLPLDGQAGLAATTRGFALAHAKNVSESEACASGDRVDLGYQRSYP
jgi:hypothetical protein